MKIYYSLESFKDQFDNSLSKFIQEYKDSTLSDFIQENRILYDNCLDNVQYIDEPSIGPVIKSKLTGENIIEEIQDRIHSKGEIVEQERKNLKFTFAAIINFLDQYENDQEIIPNNATTNNLNWDGSELELTEIIKALIESKKIKGKSEKEIFQIFSNLFNIKIDKREKLQTVRKRTLDKTPFIDTLQISLKAWINKA